MISRELYINDQLAELDPLQTDIEWVFQVNDIAELEDRQATFSSEITLPFTKANQDIFDYASEIPSKSKKPYKKLPCRYIEKGVQIIKAGYAIGAKAEKGYVVTVYGGIFNFFNQLAQGVSKDGSLGLKLSDLDTSDIDHFWNATSIEQSITTDLGYIYPFTDSGQIKSYRSGVTNTVDCYHLHPHVYVKHIINKIFASQKFSLQGNVWTEIGNRLDKALIPITNHAFNPFYLPAKGVTQVDLFSSDLVAPFNNFNVVEDDMPAAIYANKNMIVETFCAFNSSFTAYRYRCYARGSYSFRAELDVKNLSTISAGGTGFIDVVVQVNRRKGNDSAAQYDTLYTSPTIHMGEEFTDTIDLPDITCERGDRIWVGFAIAASVSGGFPTFNTWLKKGSSFECYKGEALTGFNDWYQISINLPQWSQSDFLKAIFQLLCISPSSINEKGIIVLNQFNDLPKNLSKAKDITSKIDRTNPPMIEYRNTFSNTYGQVNWMRYTPDNSNTVIGQSGNPNTSDTVNNIFGVPILSNGKPLGIADANFSIPDETLQLLSEILTVQFSATLDETVLETPIHAARINLYNFVQVVDGIGITHPHPFDFNNVYQQSADDYVIYKGRLYQCIYHDVQHKEPDEEAFNTPNTGGGGYWKLIEDRTNTVGDKIVMLEDRVVLSTGYQLVYNDSAISSAITNPPLTYFRKTNGRNNLDFNSLLKTEYYFLVAMLTDFKKVTVPAHFNQLDIEQLNHFYPLYDTVTSSYYYLNRVYPYIAGKLTTLEMIKLP